MDNYGQKARLRDLLQAAQPDQMGRNDLVDRAREIYQRGVRQIEAVKPPVAPQKKRRLFTFW